MLKRTNINAFGGGQALEPPCKKAFTLTELLLALSIVGVLAILTVPILMNNIHKKMFATQVKNMVANIEQVAQDELITHRTRDLSDTDFGDPDLLLSDKHFAIAKICNDATISGKECWKTTATGKDKVTYKNLNKSQLSISVRPYYRAIILKNGVIINYSTSALDSQLAKDRGVIGLFQMDINGNDKPNIGGRDLFYFYIDNKGHTKDFSIRSETEYSLGQKKAHCKVDYLYCYGALADNNWKMDY